MKFKPHYLLALPAAVFMSCTVVDHEPRVTVTTETTQRIIKTTPITRERVITERPVTNETVITQRPIRKEIRETVIRERPAVDREIIVRRAPPTTRVELRTEAPSRNHIYTSGYWHWTGADYEWVPGRWVARRSATSVWHDGEWVSRGGGFAWSPGYWEP